MILITHRQLFNKGMNSVESVEALQIFMNINRMGQLSVNKTRGTSRVNPVKFIRKN